MIKYRVNFEGGYNEFTFLIHAQQYAQNIPEATIEEIEYELENENNTPLKITNDFNIQDPKIVDYDILGYHKERVFVSGELTQVNYYRFCDEITRIFSDKVIEENRTYLRNTIGIPYKRFLTIKWLREDGTIGVIIENRPKFYSLIDSLQETESRRENSILEVKEYLFGYLLQANNFDENNTLLQSAEILSAIGANNILTYVKGEGNSLNTAIQNLNLAYVSEQLKTNILNILNYAL